jgi:hypothetical protein
MGRVQHTSSTIGGRVKSEGYGYGGNEAAVHIGISDAARSDSSQDPRKV